METKIKNYIRDNPLLMAEWNYEKNTSLNPLKITIGCNKKVWWKCSKDGCGYEWEAKVGNRAILHRGCPVCNNRTVVIGKNDLATTHPEIAKEWHPSKGQVKKYGGYVLKGTNIKQLCYIEHREKVQTVQFVMKKDKGLLQNRRFIFMLKSFFLMQYMDIKQSFLAEWNWMFIFLPLNMLLNMMGKHGIQMKD
ncbi:MAG: zinc-ribbon domain-containing protein [Acidaminococcaceae bacterium]|nr:zinc-ribbon domain-containing protein [Acidaminococcaceae bacterium]